MHLPSATSANIVTDFMGTSFLMCLLGGFPADSFIGRYKTIAIFAVVQSVGTGILAISTRLPDLHPPPCKKITSETCIQASGFQMSIFYMSLYVIALGTGGLKSSVSGFGTDQFDDKDEKEKARMAYFFNRFLLFISMGTITAVTVLVYIQDEVAKEKLAYGICSASMFIAVLIFLSGTKRYRYKKGLGLTRPKKRTQVQASFGTPGYRECWPGVWMIVWFQSLGSLTAFFVGAIMITIAVHDRLIMPFWKKWKGKHGFSSLQSISIGLIMSTIMSTIGMALQYGCM
ncbi:hypothetical protein IFM89_029056 [Coptis chinensis]|uniref:Uncharacterized protein n=1 Tax=Coptis chinensis TaxID=261450 RepID=A0A835IC96_9MAGN|nr:hypothetical protein IFM89_029056 [Coptis chinensis]